MLLEKQDIIEIDLDTGTIERSFSSRAIGEGDINGDRFGAKLKRNGAPVNISECTVTGYFVRSDGVTIIVPGEVENNTAIVQLTQSCYAVSGNFSLAIKLTGAGATVTIRMVDGMVIDTTTDDVSDPSGVVPDIDELLAVIGRAEDAAEEIASFVITEELISGTDYCLIVNVSEG